jgi:drug/metabolite transporter (DMT)-like permease
VALAFVRIGLPALIAVAGIVLVVVGGDVGQGAGVALIGAAVLIVLANLFIRLAIASERDREREAERRERRLP